MLCVALMVSLFRDTYNVAHAANEDKLVVENTKTDFIDELSDIIKT